VGAVSAADVFLLPSPLFYHKRVQPNIALGSLGSVMSPQLRKSHAWAGVLAALLLIAEPAAAFRCGTRLVVDGMHEQQVLAACGEPTTRRHLGYTIRSFSFDSRHAYPGWTRSHFPGYSTFAEEVIVTEFVYNFGPRKFMRRLRFEGGILVAIETIGRGYVDRDP